MSREEASASSSNSKTRSWNTNTSTSGDNRNSSRSPSNQVRLLRWLGSSPSDTHTHDVHVHETMDMNGNMNGTSPSTSGNRRLSVSALTGIDTVDTNAILSEAMEVSARAARGAGPAFEFQWEPRSRSRSRARNQSQQRQSSMNASNANVNNMDMNMTVNVAAQSEIASRLRMQAIRTASAAAQRRDSASALASTLPNRGGGRMTSVNVNVPSSFLATHTHTGAHTSPDYSVNMFADVSSGAGASASANRNLNSRMDINVDANSNIDMNMNTYTSPTRSGSGSTGVSPNGNVNGMNLNYSSERNRTRTRSRRTPVGPANSSPGPGDGEVSVAGTGTRSVQLPVPIAVPIPVPAPVTVPLHVPVPIAAVPVPFQVVHSSNNVGVGVNGLQMPASPSTSSSASPSTRTCPRPRGTILENELNRHHARLEELQQQHRRASLSYLNNVGSTSSASVNVNASASASARNSQNEAEDDRTMRAGDIIVENAIATAIAANSYQSGSDLMLSHLAQRRRMLAQRRHSASAILALRSSNNNESRSSSLSSNAESTLNANANAHRANGRARMRAQIRRFYYLPDGDNLMSQQADSTIHSGGTNPDSEAATMADSNSNSNSDSMSPNVDAAVDALNHLEERDRARSRTRRLHPFNPFLPMDGANSNTRANHRSLSSSISSPSMFHYDNEHVWPAPSNLNSNATFNASRRMNDSMPNLNDLHFDNVNQATNLSMNSMEGSAFQFANSLWDLDRRGGDHHDSDDDDDDDDDDSVSFIGVTHYSGGAGSASCSASSIRHVDANASTSGTATTSEGSKSSPCARTSTRSGSRRSAGARNNNSGRVEAQATRRSIRVANIRNSRSDPNLASNDSEGDSKPPAGLTESTPSSTDVPPAMTRSGSDLDSSTTINPASGRRRMTRSMARARNSGHKTNANTVNNASIVIDVDAEDDYEPSPPAKSTRSSRKRTRSSSPDRKKAAPKPSTCTDCDAKKNDESENCCICLDKPVEKELAKLDGCDHPYCFTCIEKWSERENTCPQCKARFTKIERVHKIKRRRGNGSPVKESNVKKVKDRDQRADYRHQNPLQSLFANMESVGMQHLNFLISGDVGETWLHRSGRGGGSVSVSANPGVGSIEASIGLFSSPNMTRAFSMGVPNIQAQILHARRASRSHPNSNQSGGEAARRRGVNDPWSTGSTGGVNQARSRNVSDSHHAFIQRVASLNRRSEYERGRNLRMFHNAHAPISNVVEILDSDEE